MLTNSWNEETLVGLTVSVEPDNQINDKRHAEKNLPFVLIFVVIVRESIIFVIIEYSEDRALSHLVLNEK